MNRRLFIKRLLGAGALGIGGTAYGTVIEPDSIVVEKIEVPIQGLAVELDGFRIVAMSDFHLHPFTQIDLIERAVRIANSLNADVAALLGDFVDESAEAIHELAPALGKLRAPRGLFAVLGNHDLWKGAGTVTTALERHGIRVLRNAGTEIRAGKAAFHLAGVDDVWAGRPDVSKALAGCSANVPAVVLCHEPDYGDEVARDPRARLQLSGHTHGGQIRLPILGALRLPSLGEKYQAGLYNVAGMRLYTTRGIGCVGVPVRINCPPEVTLITLRASAFEKLAARTGFEPVYQP